MLTPRYLPPSQIRHMGVWLSIGRRPSWCRIEPVGIGCYFERDIVYTLQKRLVAQIDAERPPFRVYNDYPISRAQ